MQSAPGTGRTPRQRHTTSHRRDSGVRLGAWEARRKVVDGRRPRAWSHLHRLRAQTPADQCRLPAVACERGLCQHSCRARWTCRTRRQLRRGRRAQPDRTMAVAYKGARSDATRLSTKEALPPHSFRGLTSRTATTGGIRRSALPPGTCHRTIRQCKCLRVQSKLHLEAAAKAPGFVA